MLNLRTVRSARASLVWIVMLAGGCGEETSTTNDARVVVPCDEAVGPCLARGTACTIATDCASGFCVDDVCCESFCGGGALDCQSCVGADAGEGFCHPLAANTVCRASPGSCDLAEVCDGTSGACPGDVLLPAGIPCRGVAGPCDKAETCTGVDSACPVDAKQPAATVCRAAVGPCDVADVCNGATDACPDLFRIAGQVCNAAIFGPCDAPDVCTGSSAHCPPAYLAGVECRSTTGACDLSEFCDGASESCPPNAVLSSGIVCRASVNLTCDPTERCDGVATSCPANVTSCP